MKNATTVDCVKKDGGVKEVCTAEVNIDCNDRLSLQKSVSLVRTAMKSGPGGVKI